MILDALSSARAFLAIEKDYERLLRSTSALDRDGVPYAVIGGNAVAAWVAKVDEDAIRSTKDVDLLIRREDLDAVTRSLDRVGFEFGARLRADLLARLEELKANPKERLG